MNAEKVYFGAVEDLLADAHLYWDARYEGDELARGGCANTDVPFLLPPGRFQGPTNVSPSLRVALKQPYQFRNDGEYLKRKVASLSST